MLTNDRFGLTWHPALAPDIVRARERIDTLEVIPEVALRATRGDRDFLRILAREIPVSLHGVSLGLASASPVEEWRLEEMARLVEEVQPEDWSEHLAFVRAGGIELGHLAAPPRTDAVLEGLTANLRRARRIVGSAPALENVATLLDPPGSTCDEQTWLCDVLPATGAPLLLDLHNVCTNAVNLRYDAKAFVRALPLERITTVHIAGGTEAADPATGAHAAGGRPPPRRSGRSVRVADAGWRTRAAAAHHRAGTGRRLPAVRADARRARAGQGGAGGRTASPGSGGA